MSILTAEDKVGEPEEIVKDVQEAGHEDEDKGRAENDASGTRVLPLREVSQPEQIDFADFLLTLSKL